LWYLSGEFNLNTAHKAERRQLSEDTHITFNFTTMSLFQTARSCLQESDKCKIGKDLEGNDPDVFQILYLKLFEGAEEATNNFSCKRCTGRDTNPASLAYKPGVQRHTSYPAPRLRHLTVKYN
jgi:hypothetical protein